MHRRVRRCVAPSLYYGDLDPSDPVDDARYTERSLYQNLVSQLSTGGGVDPEDIDAYHRARENVRAAAAVWSDWDGALGSHDCWRAA